MPRLLKHTQELVIAAFPALPEKPSLQLLAFTVPPFVTSGSHSHALASDRDIDSSISQANNDERSLAGGR